MVEGLSQLITSQGWLAPAWYVAGFLCAALIPVIPTPLIAALGGTAFGTVPAILYGTVGLGLGAALALYLSRRFGRPILKRLLSKKAWNEWEALTGVDSLVVWFVVFLALNVDVAVFVAGMSGLSARSLWMVAMAARVPWLIVAAWAGERLFVNDAAFIGILLAMIPVVWGLSKLRPALRHRLAEWAVQHGHDDASHGRPSADDIGASSLHEPGIQDVTHGVAEQVEPHHRREDGDAREDRHPRSP